jgi:hypothetical protein
MFADPFMADTYYGIIDFTTKLLNIKKMILFNLYQNIVHNAKYDGGYWYFVGSAPSFKEVPVFPTTPN